MSALSALVVDNSDFYTGAFPAEYGNALSGVFDIKLRSGNNERHEHAVQLGTLGLDLSSEGPIGKGSTASYLFNYRYSTFGLIKFVLPQEIKDFVPVYQDLSFKINIPTDQTGIFSIWGLAARNKQNYDAEQDSSLWESVDDQIVSILGRFHINAGLHGQYFALNKEWAIEPRLGMTYQLGKAQSISLAYGKHSRLEPLILYFASLDDGGSISRPNLDLKLTKSHHLVFSYDISLNPDLRLKIEPYAQFLYDVPVIPDSNYSVLNMEAEWYFNQELVNTGRGQNTGIDITLERFLKKGFYYLITASMFNSRYKGDDGMDRNTRFNTHYVFNVLYGKEWALGRHKNQILGVYGRVNYLGGKRTTLVDAYQSDIAQDVVYDYSRLYEEKESDIYFVGVGINYRINKKNHSSIWTLQISNLLVAKENYGLYYNYKTKQVEPFELGVIVPNLSYRIEF